MNRKRFITFYHFVLKSTAKKRECPLGLSASSRREDRGDRENVYPPIDKRKLEAACGIHDADVQRLREKSLGNLSRSPRHLCRRIHHAGLAKSTLPTHRVQFMFKISTKIALLPYIIMELQQPVQVAVASSLPALFLSQLPGIMIHGTQAAMMVVSLEVGGRHRTAHLAYLNLSYCVGLVAGGAIGATLANAVGPRGTLVVASAIQLCGCFLAFLLGWTSMKTEAARFSSIAHACAPQCFVMVVGLFPRLVTIESKLKIHLFRPHRENAADAAPEGFHFATQPSQSNVLVTLIGATMIGNLYLLSTSTSRDYIDLHDSFVAAEGDRACIKYCCPIAVAGFLWYICCTSQMTKLVNREELGSVLGLNASLFFLDAGLSQLIGLPIYAAYGGAFRRIHLLLHAFFFFVQGLQTLWFICTVITALVAAYLLVIDAHTFKAFSEEERIVFPLRSAYE
ncbi:hypothetical protein Esti_003635 [Eimeria stiedai]